MAGESYHLNAEKVEPDCQRALGPSRGRIDGPTPNEVEGWSQAMKPLPYFTGSRVHIFP